MEQNEDIEFNELTKEEIELANEYFDRGKKAYKEKKHDEALKWIDKCLEINENDTDYLFLKSISLGSLNRIDESFETADKGIKIFYSLEKAIKIKLENESESIDTKAKEAFKNRLKDIKSGTQLFYNIKAVNYALLEDYVNTGLYIIKSQDSLISFSSFNKFQFIAKEVLNQNGDKLFSQTIAKGNKYLKNYQNIYIKSLEIVASLYVEREEETTQVAHYTSKTVAEALFAEKSPFRLSTVANANDPQEGKPLLKYLEIEENCISEDYQAFVGSFIFNPDSLNQFRLYGKESGVEATGVSIVLNKEYFNKELNINRSLSQMQDFKIQDIDENSRKETLFRCIYLDPDTEQVISVGHKEEYTFLREKHKEKGKIYKKTINDYKKYKKYIDDLVDDLRGSLGDLKNEIDDLLGKAKNESEKQEMRRTVCELLIHLRYLVKHVAFKEEQECRLIRVEPLEGNSEIQYQDNRMFIDYLPVTNYVTDIYFGPKAQGIHLFRDMLKLKGIKGVKCHQSDHPFFA